MMPDTYRCILPSRTINNLWIEPFIPQESHKVERLYGKIALVEVIAINRLATFLDRLTFALLLYRRITAEIVPIEIYATIVLQITWMIND